MRLSEAIRLGSLVLTPRAYCVLDGNGNGCALGMGFYSTGSRTYQDCATAARDGQWAWLAKKPTERPSFCSCEEWSPVFSHITLTARGDYRAWLSHWFNEHVMDDCAPRMTLDFLCDQVRAWEDELAAKGINVEQASMAATPETTHEPAAEHTEMVGVSDARDRDSV